MRQLLGLLFFAGIVALALMWGPKNNTPKAKAEGATTTNSVTAITENGANFEYAPFGTPPPEKAFRTNK